MSKLMDEARRLENEAQQFNHPMVPARYRAVVKDSARLVRQLAEEVETLKRGGPGNGETA